MLSNLSIPEFQNHQSLLPCIAIRSNLFRILYPNHSNLRLQCLGLFLQAGDLGMQQGLSCQSGTQQDLRILHFPYYLLRPHKPSYGRIWSAFPGMNNHYRSQWDKLKCWLMRCVVCRNSHRNHYPHQNRRRLL